MKNLCSIMKTQSSNPRPPSTQNVKCFLTEGPLFMEPAEENKGGGGEDR